MRRLRTGSAVSHLLHPHRLHLAQELTIEGPGAAVAAATAVGAAMAVAADAEFDNHVNTTSKNEQVRNHMQQVWNICRLMKCLTVNFRCCCVLCVRAAQCLHTLAKIAKLATHSAILTQVDTTRRTYDTLKPWLTQSVPLPQQSLIFWKRLRRISC